ncbi:MAG: pyridoxal phosphate-dependent aminotransferase, partial [Oscillospiraceae bacterium]|nr:pyridoxal phosphate-dependent aminotransferase [Oscillospiraceae bacterium]
MISDKMAALVRGSSVIRAMFEEGARLAAEIGRENVYDFSLGNPNFPPPAAVDTAIRDVLSDTPPNVVHGYMTNAGYPEVRRA